MKVYLKRAVFEDCPEIYAMQIEAFSALLEKYQDYDFSPGAEKLERTIKRFRELIMAYYWIVCEGERICALRVCDFGRLCKLKQIFILRKYQNRGYAQAAIEQIHALYPNSLRWEVDTILQKEKLCHLYEKMGYRKTGRTEPIKEGMDLVFYVRESRAPASEE